MYTLLGFIIGCIVFCLCSACSLICYNLNTFWLVILIWRLHTIRFKSDIHHNNSKPSTWFVHQRNYLSRSKQLCKRLNATPTPFIPLYSIRFLMQPTFYPKIPLLCFFYNPFPFIRTLLSILLSLYAFAQLHDWIAPLAGHHWTPGWVRQMPNEHRPNQWPPNGRNHRNLSEKDAARNEKPRTSVWNALVFHRLALSSQHTFACFLLVSRLAVGLMHF